jgi:CRP/FNR family transcriptional regulator
MSNENREILNLLARTAPFSSASASDLAALAGSASLHRFPAGAQVFLEGERSPAAWVTLSGRVRILNFASGSRTFQVERFGPRQLFGICCRVGGGADRYPCTAVAETELAAVRVPDAAFHSTYRRSGAFARASCEVCSARLRGMRRQAAFGRRAVRPRVAQVLLGLRETGGDEVRATRHALAEWVGAAPETVFRALADLRRRGVVETGRGTVRVLDAAALARECEAEGEPA